MLVCALKIPVPRNSSAQYYHNKTTVSTNLDHVAWMGVRGRGSRIQDNQGAREGGIVACLHGDRDSVGTVLPA
jgi:hypothetical protein